MTRQSLSDGNDDVIRPMLVNHQARMVIGGLTTVQRTHTLIDEQARQLEALDLVCPSDLRRLQDLAKEVTDLITHYRAGRFLGGLKPLIDQTRHRDRT